MFVFLVTEIRNKIATVRGTVAATSANTGGFVYFRLWRKCKRISRIKCRQEHFFDIFSRKASTHRVFVFLVTEIRSKIATVRGTVAATSANTGGFVVFLRQIALSDEKIPRRLSLPIFKQDLVQFRLYISKGMPTI